MTLGPLLEKQLLVCFGTGGVGKTTTAAALALSAALSGRRAMVLTIDPARALARAFGMSTLAAEPERIEPAVLQTAGINAEVALHAAMLDQKSAWDSFIRRHAESPELAERIIGNAFYRQLSTRFAGATEYVAMEEICHLSDSGRWDTLVLDTPAAAHALDFARAPARIDRMLEPEVVRWLTGGTRETLRAGGAIARRVIRRLERATGAETLGSMAELFGSLESMLGSLRRRTARARSLLSSERAAFVLVTAPRPFVLEQTEALTRTARELGLPIAAVVFNRAHPAPKALADAAAEWGVRELLASLPASAGRDWLARTIERSRATAAAEKREIFGFSALHPDAIWAAVPELDHDLHSLADLRTVAELLVPELSSAARASASARSPEVATRAPGTRAP